ncbi:hypothetical protein [Streptomyces milbemycinicus]|uniref:Uncharacterized protein n=1 Tax=Streptomyces milbemycinicus TaxID=476552 RepID=A0ABW8LR35_9ACTN
MKVKLAYVEPTVVVLGTVEELTGWLTIGQTFDNVITTHRRLN